MTRTILNDIALGHTKTNIRLKRARSRSPSPAMENGKLTAIQSMESVADHDHPTTAVAGAPTTATASSTSTSSTTTNTVITNSVPTPVSSAQVRTLFVSGLPMDAKPRELYLLFRAYSGYESSLLKITSKNGKTASPVGFVTFSTKAEADEARKALQGVRFDPDNAQTIRLELARSNTKVSKPKQFSASLPTGALLTNGCTAAGVTNATAIQPPPPPSSVLQQAVNAAASQFVNSLPTSNPHDLATAAAAVCLDPNNLTQLLNEHQLLALSAAGLPQFPHTSSLLFHSTPGLPPLQQVASNPAAAAAAAAAAAMFQPNSQAAALAQFTAASQAAAAQLSVAQQQAVAAVGSTTPVAATAPPTGIPNMACSTLFVANLGQMVNEEELKQVRILVFF